MFIVICLNDWKPVSSISFTFAILVSYPSIRIKADTTSLTATGGFP